MQSGVKSAGCEKRTNHFPAQSLSFLKPAVVGASKAGAGSFNLGKDGVETEVSIFGSFLREVKFMNHNIYLYINFNIKLIISQ